MEYFGDFFKIFNIILFIVFRSQILWRNLPLNMLVLSNIPIFEE